MIWKSSKPWYKRHKDPLIVVASVIATFLIGCLLLAGNAVWAVIMIVCWPMATAMAAEDALWRKRT